MRQRHLNLVTPTTPKSNRRDALKSIRWGPSRISSRARWRAVASFNPDQKTAICDSHHPEKRQVVTTITFRKAARSALLEGRQLLGKGGVMGAHGDGSMERNRQPTVLDNSGLASGLVSAGSRRGARCRVTNGRRIDFRARSANAAVSMPTGKAPMRTARSATTKLKSRLCKPHSRVIPAEIKCVVAGLKSNKIVVAE